MKPEPSYHRVRRSVMLLRKVYKILGDDRAFILPCVEDLQDNEHRLRMSVCLQHRSMLEAIRGMMLDLSHLEAYEAWHLVKEENASLR